MIPAGALVYFKSKSCPEGWGEATEGYGRTIVGMVGSAGSLAAQVGPALIDQEARVHAHQVDPATATTEDAGSHNHQWFEDGLHTYTNTGADQGLVLMFPDGGGTNQRVLLDVGGVDYFTDQHGTHNHAFDQGSSTTNPLEPELRSSDFTTLPYIQFLLCERLPDS